MMRIHVTNSAFVCTNRATKNGAYEQYITLTDKNRDLAQKLYETANLKDYESSKVIKIGDGSPSAKAVSATKAKIVKFRVSKSYF